MKLYGVPENSPTGELVRELEQACAERGLTLSRWQANSTKVHFACTVTWAAHKGERAGQYRYQNKDDVVGVVYLRGLEGKTERCEAYRKLSSLLDAVRSYQP